MSRIAKKPEDRKNEILDTANRLFVELGYDNTSVERIIKELNLAKGTFYYYFKSKADLIEAIADRHAEIHYERWKKIFNRTDINAVEKLNSAFDVSLSLKLKNKQMVVSYLKAMLDDQNFMLRHKMGEKRIQITSEIFGKVVEEGVREGCFNTPYPKESVVMILKLAESMTDEIAPLVMKMFEDESYIQLVRNKYDTLTFAMERILGAKEGTLKIYDPEKLEKFVKEG